jgi:hypothetical protein
MTTKLTLSMEEKVIRKAKEFAKKNDTSLSQIIEDYFIRLTQKEIEGKGAISVRVKKLSGVIQLSKDADLEEERRKYLEGRFMKQ